MKLTRLYGIGFTLVLIASIVTIFFVHLDCKAQCPTGISLPPFFVRSTNTPSPAQETWIEVKGLIAGEGWGEGKKPHICNAILTLSLAISRVQQLIFTRGSVAGEGTVPCLAIDVDKAVSRRNVKSQQTLIKPLSDRKLISIIPTFRLRATRKILYPTPLRKAEQVVINEDDNDMMNDSWVLMDKVVVIPKVIG